MNPKLLISNYFDYLINLIDIHTEEELAKSNENNLVENLFQYELEDEKICQLNNKKYSQWHDFSHQPKRSIPPGSVKVINFLNETRDTLIAEVNAAQVDAFKRCDELRDELKVISKDETKSQEDREDEIKGKVFANQFLGLVQIDQIVDSDSEQTYNPSPFKLYLIKLNYYMGKDEQFFFR